MSQSNVAVIGIVLLCIGIGAGYFLAPSGIPLSEYQELETKMDVETNAHETTIIEYETNLENAEIRAKRYQDDLTEKNTEYTSLMDERNDLVEDWNGLVADWNDQIADWDDLVVDYNEMNENYSRSIYYEWDWEEVFDDPSVETVTPRLGLVYNWLRLDKTDKMEYSDNYDCSQYAASVCLNAKQENWDMGIVIVWGNYTRGESYAHAFNAIVTEDGLVYIEPQTDEVWWMKDHEELQVNDTANINGDLIKIRDIRLSASYN
ncbi:hypothetical protein HOB30_00445 [Candidatus Falkowbacteria bacterium]|jgi:hypothetical protein|nr:hypothetical protein [Candidatus Falkowbacteria bacterium]